MKISELKQPYRAIAEADYLEHNIKIKAVNYNAILDDFYWIETRAGYVFYRNLHLDGWSPITNQIRKDYADVFAKLENQPEWTPVKGEMVEVSDNNKNWATREFIHDLGEDFNYRFLVLGVQSLNAKKTFFYYKHIRRIQPVTEFTKELAIEFGVYFNGMSTNNVYGAMDMFIQKKKLGNFKRRQVESYCQSSELSITHAMREVEKLGADILLTDAVCLLEKAREKVSDYIDNKENDSLKTFGSIRKY